MDEADLLLTRTPPPFRDYLTAGVTRESALATCLQVVHENPELAAPYLLWLVDEVRASGWADPPER
jgi:hypothetical protein